MTFEDFLRRFPDAIQSDDRQWSARCRAHSDTNPSLSISIKEDGTRLLYCHAGCPPEAVLRAHALSMADLYDNHRREISATYLYRDEGGLLLYEVVRFEPKTFRQRRPNGQGGYVWDVKGVRHVLYRLPELKGQERVFIVEGEKDADRLAALGLAATTNVGGAGKWKDDYTTQLVDAGVKSVVILPDNDKPGQDHARAVVRSCLTAGLTVKLVPLRDGKDVSDWLEAGHSFQELSQVVEAASHFRDDDEPWRAKETPRDILDWVSKEGERKTAAGEQWGSGVLPAILSRFLDLVASTTKDELDADLYLEEGKPIWGYRMEPARERVKQLRKVSATAGDAFLKDPDPWDASVDLAELLDDIVKTLNTYLVLPRYGAEASALWFVLTYCHEVFDILPMLALQSPEMRCGKSTFLDIASAIVRRALETSLITPSALFRTVEEECPTLILDEADSTLRKHEEINAIFNSGHRRRTGSVTITVGDDHKRKRFSTWCPKMLALIGRLPPTMEDRSLVIPMNRKDDNEHVEDYVDSEHWELLRPLARRAMRWTMDNLESLRGAKPTIPKELKNRAKDNAKPLLAIAERAGGRWPEVGREAVLHMFRAVRKKEPDSNGTLLLRDIRAFSVEQAKLSESLPSLNRGKLQTSSLLTYLNAMPESPWATYNRRGLDARSLAEMLSLYDIEPTSLNMIVGGERKTPRGYLLEEFENAFRRYLPPLESSFSPQLPQPDQDSQPLGAFPDPQPPHKVADTKVDLSSGSNGPVADVADKNTERAGGEGTEPSAVAPARIPRTPVE